MAGSFRLAALNPYLPLADSFPATTIKTPGPVYFPIFESSAMPYLKCHEAGERIASAIHTVSAGALHEIASDLLPETRAEPARLATELAATVRRGVAPELLVDLWNVVFPEDHDVWFNEETNELHYETGLVESAD